eukprot:TRINITY_DN17025_c0_g1_i1.p1 TRINITY_DN17025_c0_g1~~TRINITY_DN17025_c0_g1_i1.p1  ORF type:complete len:597 (-),score=141.85 TRINITY_DN17025_c0_g1_i1:37-1827(-)
MSTAGASMASISSAASVDRRRSAHDTSTRGLELSDMSPTSKRKSNTNAQRLKTKDPDLDLQQLAFTANHYRTQVLQKTVQGARTQQHGTPLKTNQQEQQQLIQQQLAQQRKLPSSSHTGGAGLSQSEPVKKRDKLKNWFDDVGKAFKDAGRAMEEAFASTPGKPMERLHGSDGRQRSATEYDYGDIPTQLPSDDQRLLSTFGIDTNKEHILMDCKCSAFTRSKTLRGHCYITESFFLFSGTGNIKALLPWLQVLSVQPGYSEDRLKTSRSNSSSTLPAAESSFDSDCGDGDGDGSAAGSAVGGGTGGAGGAGGGGGDYLRPPGGGKDANRLEPVVDTLALYTSDRKMHRFSEFDCNFLRLYNTAYFAWQTSHAMDIMKQQHMDGLRESGALSRRRASTAERPNGHRSAPSRTQPPSSNHNDDTLPLFEEESRSPLGNSQGSAISDDLTTDESEESVEASQDTSNTSATAPRFESPLKTELAAAEEGDTSVLFERPEGRGVGRGAARAHSGRRYVSRGNSNDDSDDHREKDEGVEETTATSEASPLDYMKYSNRNLGLRSEMNVGKPRQLSDSDVDHAARSPPAAPTTGKRGMERDR